MSAGGEQEKLLNYNGTVLVFQLLKVKSAEGGADKLATLHFRRMAFNPAAGVFHQTSTGFLNIPAIYAGAEIISCSCVADSRTGMNLPCILLGKTKKHKETKYLLLLLHASDELECYLHFKWDYKMKDDIHLVAGPMVLWRHGNQLFYVSSTTRIVLSAPVQFSSIKWAGEIENEGIVVIGINRTHVSDDHDAKSHSILDSVIWHSEFTVYAVEKQEVMNATAFLPHAYSSVVTCMHIHVCRTETVSGQFRTSVVAATRSNQLVWFQDGVPGNVFQLPGRGDLPCQVHAASTGRGDLLLLVTFASSNVCAVWKDTWQVAFSWQNVKSVLVDDFIASGNEQILLLFKNSSANSDCLNIFRITDFGEVNYTSDTSECKEHIPAEDDIQENRFLTIQALEARLQESLVSLWDERENPLSSSDKEAVFPTEDPERLMENMWQRVVDTSLVVGVKINHNAGSTLNDFSLSLVMEQNFSNDSPVTKCYSNVLRVTSLASETPKAVRDMEPLPKRIKRSCYSKKDSKKEFNEQHLSETHANLFQTVTAVTDLMPLLTLQNVSCVVLLHVRKRIHEDEYSEESEMLTFPCGRISIGLEDISKDKYVVHSLLDDHQHTDTVEDFYAILAAYYKYSFQIFSSDCTLAPVNIWLLEQMQCNPILECPEYLHCSRQGRLYGTIFKWNPRTPCEGTLTLFCRNQTILFQCLHKLIGILPSTCVPRLLSFGSKDSLTENLALSLEKEMLALRSSVTSAVSEIERESTWKHRSEKKMSIATSGSLSKEEVQQYREELQNEQKQSTLQMNLTVSSALYRRIMWKIAQIQVNSDSVVWRLSNSLQLYFA
ncbi:Fanconi anemia group B protein isoform X2 [Rhinatrema bivittatum]|uniref:Fanconi anemia group B protein isoform X2 n=1 Tax=Rhinatrema bivittatum TaxID=194408 RepID=UPI00112B6B5E|nr:Fanconi anemia group B protein isoform X2 [Rhinatrema bivittatum]